MNKVNDFITMIIYNIQTTTQSFKLKFENPENKAN